MNQDLDVVLCTVSGRIEVISSDGYTSSTLFQAIREAIFEDNMELQENIKPLVWATATFLNEVHPTTTRIEPVWSSGNRTRERFLFLGEHKAWTCMSDAGEMRKFDSKINRSERISINQGVMHLTINLNYKMLVISAPDRNTLNLLVEDHTKNQLGQHRWVLETKGILGHYIQTLNN